MSSALEVCSHPAVQLVLAKVEGVQIMPLLDRLYHGNEQAARLNLQQSSGASADGDAVHSRNGELRLPECFGTDGVTLERANGVLCDHASVERGVWITSRACGGRSWSTIAKIPPGASPSKRGGEKKRLP